MVILSLVKLLKLHEVTVLQAEFTTAFGLLYFYFSAKCILGY